MQIIYLPKAQKQISRLPKNRQIKVLKTVRKLAADPRAGKGLKGELLGLRSARAWPYRIIYRFLKERNLLVIESVQHRQSVYKTR